MNRRAPSPPRWIDRLLESFCTPQLLEEVQGDMHELYGEWADEHGKSKAKWLYMWHTIKFFRLFALKQPKNVYPTNAFAMIQNYVKIAFRNLSQHKTYVSINLLGMGFALACCIVAFLNLDYKLRFDEYHSDKTTNVYRVNTIRVTDNGKEAWGLSPLTLGARLSQDIPGLQATIRLHSASGIANANDKTFSEIIHYADMELLNVFNFPLRYGDTTAFYNPNKLVLSTNAAVKYFGKKNPVGEEMVVIDAFQRKKSLIVGAVTQRVPENTSILFDIMLPIHHLFEPQQLPESDWRSTDQISLFVKLAPQIDPAEINILLDRYIADNNAFRDDFEVADFYLQPFSELAFTSDIDLPGWVQGRALNRNAVGFLVGITLFLSLLILLTACFNFANTSVAFSSNRLKEIGIRKVMGGARQQIIGQFMVENLLLCFFSIVIGLAGAQYLIDAYNGLFEQTLDMRYVFTSRVLIFLVGLPVITAILAGSYPALRISKYQPALILKGKTRFASMGRLSKVLLTAQFSFSCFALIGSIILTQNATYQNQLDFGYDMHKVAVTSINDPQKLSVFQNTVSQHPQIEKLAGSAQIIGQSYEVPAKIQPDDMSLEVRRLDIGSNYLSTVGIDLITGRDFISDSRHDQEQAVIVNKKAVEALDLENDPINQQIFIEEQLYQIIGLVENHKEFGLRGEEPACVFTLADPDQFQYLSVSATEDQLTEVSEYLRQSWFQVNPMIPYEGFFQEMLIFKQIYMNNILRNLCLFLTVATLLMSAAGFFSLISLRVLKRTKEISIRKVLGGSVSQMMRLIMNDFIRFVLIAFVIGSVLGYIVIQKVLFAQMYTYHIPFGIETFGFALLVMLLVPGITVGYKVYRTAVANPSETLKHE